MNADNTDEEEFEGNSLSYRNVAPGEVEIRWTFPKNILDSVIGKVLISILILRKNRHYDESF